MFDEICQNLLWKDEKITLCPKKSLSFGGKSTFAAIVFVGTLRLLKALSGYQVKSEHFGMPAHGVLYCCCYISKESHTAIHWYESVTSVGFQPH